LTSSRFIISPISKPRVNLFQAIHLKPEPYQEEEEDSDAAQRSVESWPAGARARTQGSAEEEEAEEGQREDVMAAATTLREDHNLSERSDDELDVEVGEEAEEGHREGPLSDIIGPKARTHDNGTIGPDARAHSVAKARTHDKGSAVEEAIAGQNLRLDTGVPRSSETLFLDVSAPPASSLRIRVDYNKGSDSSPASGDEGPASDEEVHNLNPKPEEVHNLKPET